MPCAVTRGVVSIGQSISLQREPMNETSKTMTDIWNAIQLLAEDVAQLRKEAATLRQELLTIRQVAELTGLSEKHIRRAIKLGKLPFSNVGVPHKPTYRIARADLATWISSTRTFGSEGKAKRQRDVQRHFPKLASSASKPNSVP